MNGPGDDTSVLEVGCGSIHCESFSGSRLPIAHDCAIIAVEHTLHNVFGAVSKNIFLGSVMHYLVEFELPRLLLIVDETARSILWNVDGHMLYEG
jgi:hypothetical protein